MRRHDADREAHPQEVETRADAAVLVQDLGTGGQ
jgi:hypothetical protein